MSKRTFIIAEAGVNHNGSIDIAKQLVDAAAKAGAGRGVPRPGSNAPAEMAATVEGKGREA